MSDKVYDNNMRGALFRNDKEGNEARPDYRGQCEVNRVAFWVDAWVNVDRSGKKFMSLRFKPKQTSEVPGGVRNPPPIKRPVPETDFGDDIPF